MVKKELVAKIKNVFCLVLLVMISATLLSQEKTSRELKEEQKIERQKQTEAMVNDTNFVFAARMAYPQGGRSVNLSTDNYNVKYSPGKIMGYLPYFGKSYGGAAYSSGEAGLKFEGKPDNFKVEKTKKGYQVEARMKSPNDTYTLSLSVTLDGGASLVVYSNNRSSISFSGEISEQ